MFCLGAAGPETTCSTTPRAQFFLVEDLKHPVLQLNRKSPREDLDDLVLKCGLGHGVDYKNSLQSAGS